MKAFILLITLLFFNASEVLALSITWFGTSTVLLEGEKESILFDPFITRPSKWDLLFFRDLQSDSKLVNEIIPLEKRKKIKGIFVSHTHYDHILDIGEIHKGTSSKVFGSESTLTVAKASGVAKVFHKKTKVGDLIELDEFMVQVLKGSHPPHLFDFTLASGEVDKNFSYPSSGFAYKMSEVFTFLIIHKEKKIYFNASSIPIRNGLRNIDLAIQGFTYSKNYQKIIDEQLIPSNTKIVIPTHHDDFFIPYKEELKLMSSADIKKFIKILPKKIKYQTLEKGISKKLY